MEGSEGREIFLESSEVDLERKVWAVSSVLIKAVNLFKETNVGEKEVDLKFLATCQNERMKRNQKDNYFSHRKKWACCMVENNFLKIHCVCI